MIDDFYNVYCRNGRVKIGGDYVSLDEFEAKVNQSLGRMYGIGEVTTVRANEEQLKKAIDETVAKINDRR